VKAFQKGSFSRQVFLTMLLVALVPMILFSGTMLLTLIQRVHVQIDEQAALELAQVHETLEITCGSLENSVRALVDTPLAAQELAGGKISEQALYRAMLDAIGDDSELADFILYDVKGKRVMATGRTLAAQTLSPEWGMLRRLRETGRYMLMDSQDGDAVFCAASPVLTQKGDTTGYVVAAVSPEQFAAQLAGAFNRTGNLMVLSPYWHLLYASQPAQSKAAVLALREQLLAGRPLEGEGDAYKTYTEADPATGFTLVLQRPQLFTMEMRQAYYLLGGIITLLGVGMSLWGTMLFSRRLAKPVGAISTAMTSVEHGDFSVRLKKQRNDELGRLARGFNRMMNEYQSSVERSVSRQKELNEARIRLMQSQLNPHFLYNTLDSVRWLGVEHHAPQISALATGLADLLRKSIAGEEFVLLQSELELVESYVEIQSIRFEDRFTCEIDVEEKFQSCIVPKLMLQPLVENAILHGLGQQEDGYIKVSAAQEGDDLVVSVTDNGVGIPPETVESLNRIGAPAPGQHLGLYNVDTILRLHFGSPYGVHVTSTLGEGSCVSMRLPLVSSPTVGKGREQNADGTGC
jgi:two-component system sensor histidine kinase YesM